MRSTLYKYIDYNENLKDSLRRGYLWFSNPATFNDPFEFKLQVAANLEEKDILKIFELYKKLSVNPAKSITENFNLVLQKYKTEPDKFIELYLSPFINHIMSFGVCCFSTIYDNLLMWAHYANKHQGIVIEFDQHLLDESICKMNEKVYMTVIDKINYSIDFPLINISSSYKEISEEIRKVVFTKSVDWKYENEIRIISNSTGVHHFNRKCVKRVYIGDKFSETNSLELSELIKSNFQNQNIEIIKLKIANRSYSLN